VKARGDTNTYHTPSLIFPADIKPRFTSPFSTFNHITVIHKSFKSLVSPGQVQQYRYVIHCIRTARVLLQLMFIGVYYLSFAH